MERKFLRWAVGLSLALVIVVGLSLPSAQSQKKAATDWPTFGNDAGGQRYSTLTDITPANVTKLARAWTYHMKPENYQPPTSSGGPQRQGPPGAPPRGARRRNPESQAVPLVVGGMMYLTTAYRRVVALEPETGKEIWVYEVKRGEPATRGLEYWAGDANTPPRLFFGTSNGELIALDAKTGQPATGFGKDGVVDMKEGVMNGFTDVPYGLSSPPIMYKHLVITGSHTQESPMFGASGDVRAWDGRTGKLVWTFHTVPRPGEPGNETWEGDSWKNRSGVNVWSMMTVDTARGLVFLPLGSPTYDYYGGDRKGANLYGDTLVALDANTGKVKWHFQAVHHDLWDYDLCAPPTLFDVKRQGQTIPAVAVMTKMGLLFILDRRNGKPIYGVEERPIPKTDVPGEASWPTQPFPLKPAPLARNSFKREELANLTPEHRKYCEALFDRDGGMRNEGPYTHYTTRPSVVFPGTLGGGNWNPMSFDPRLGYLFINTQDLGGIGQMQKNPEGARTPWSRTSPLGPVGRFWQPETRWPCQQPPWGRLFAVNVHTGEIVWQSVLGVTEGLPEDKQKTGRPNLGGSLATASGLVFIGATDDSRFRAFDSRTGKELWVTKIDAGAHSAPITYRGKDGKQYVVITATGGGFIADPSTADTVIAFALP
jgi:quinoprotein glucose dehydrogenase